MSEIPQEWVEKAAAVLDDAANAGFGLGCVGPTTYQVAHMALAAVLPDIRRQMAEEIATALEQDWRLGQRAHARQAALVARRVGGTP